MKKLMAIACFLAVLHVLHGRQDIHGKNAALPSQNDEVCKRLPPSLWCTSEALSKQCGYADQCKKYKDSSYNKPVEITLLYETLCPGCQKFIVDQLYPLSKNIPSEFVKIELVPYGNAKTLENGTIVCQHGEDECAYNKFESCIISSIPEQKEQISLVYCIEAQLKNKIDFDKATSKCFRTLSIGEDVQRLIQSCLVTRESTRLQEEAAARTANVYPDKHDHVPWVLFNNASLADAQLLLDDIPSLVCEWWRGDKQIPYCTVEKAYKTKMTEDRSCDGTIFKNKLQ